MRLIKPFHFWLIISAITATTNSFSMSNNNRHDPYPVYTSHDPHLFLSIRQREILRGNERFDAKKQRVSFSASPFGQNADRGRNFKQESYTSRDMSTQTAELGDLPCRWSMIPLVYGKTPKEAVLPPTLTAARDALFPGGQGLNDSGNIDPQELYGFFSIPAEYRKRGVRFEWNILFFNDFGLTAQTGFSDICFTVDKFTNKTVASDADQVKTKTLTEPNVNQYLMCKLKEITQEIGLNRESFNDCSIEDLRLSLFWRHLYEVNAHTEEWPHLMVIPYLVVGASIDTGDEKDPSSAFALPFGNNGHNALGFKAGINFDFTESIEIGAEGGLTNFFKSSFDNYFVPNHECQSGIYPFKTDVEIKPGHNIHFTGKLHAYHFIDKLSFYFQYLWLNHKKDEITLKCPDSAFKPEILEKKSNWKTQMANVGFTYDISPNIALGFLWQAPLSQRGTFRSTTVLFDFIATY